MPDKRIPGIGQALLFMLMFFAFELAIALLCFTVIDFAFGLDDVPDAAKIWFDGIIGTVSIALVLVFGKFSAQRPWSELLPFTRFWHPALFALVPFAFGLLTIRAEVIHFALAVFPEPGWVKEITGDGPSGGFADVVTSVVAAPFAEEAFFRGFVMNGFLKRYTPFKSVVVSALLFAVLHLDPYQMIGAFVGGLVYGWLRVATGSLWPCIALHALDNAICFLMPLLLQVPGAYHPGRVGFLPLWLDALGAILLVAGGIPLFRFLRSRTASRSAPTVP
jgi:membrane protease YdiL (CAAX protease family)